MTKKTRYLLLLIGLALFLMLAPLIVMYVRGIGYDFAERRFFKTGILAIRTEPKNAQIWINGAIKRKTSGDIKFLKPQEYGITITSLDYQDWSKRLAIRSGEVTWANPAPNKIFLFYKNPPSRQVAANASDFFVKDSLLFYVSGSNAVIASLENSATNENYPLPGPATSIIPSPDQKFLLVTGNSESAKPAAFLFDLNSKRLADLSDLFDTQPIFKFSPGNELFALENGTLYRIDTQQKRKTPLVDQVRAFAFQDDDLYYIKVQPNGTLSLIATQPPSLEGVELAKNLPPFQDGEIIVNFEKHIFLVLDRTLYRVTAALSRIAGSMDEWSFDDSDSSLVFTHAGELGFYNPFEDRANLITRSGLPLKSPVLRLAINHAFVIRDNQVIGMELDTRDHQNEYVFYTAEKPEKFWVDRMGKSMFVLDNGKIMALTIR